MDYKVGDVVKVRGRKDFGAVSLFDYRDDPSTATFHLECKVLAILSGPRKNPILLDVEQYKKNLVGWRLYPEDAKYFGLPDSFIGRYIWFTCPEQIIEKVER